MVKQKLTEEEKKERLSLDKKYRPSTLDDIVGNDATVDTLKTMLERDKGVPGTFLFTGPSGCGKTTLARIVARLLGAEETDIKEHNISQFRGIDMAKEIIGDTRWKPMRGEKKVYILNEVHKSTNEWQNAMLEILEEPPSYVHFLLCTTDPDKLLKTIRTRCTTFQVTALQRQKIARLVKKILGLEQVEFEEGVIQKIAEFSDGSPRQALVMLDQVIDMDNETALELLIKTGGAEASLSDLCQSLMNGNKWDTVSKIIKQMDIDDPERLRYAVLGYLSKVLLNKPSDRLSGIIELFLDSWMYSGKAGLINTCYLATKVK